MNSQAEKRKPELLSGWRPALSYQDGEVADLGPISQVVGCEKSSKVKTLAPSLSQVVFPELALLVPVASMGQPAHMDTQGQWPCPRKALPVL